MDKAISLNQPKVIAAIPCYNEERFIGEVVLNVRKYVDQVVVIDDGSHDGTSQVAIDAGALIVKHNVNKGYGESLKSCFEAAKANGAEIVVILDGDNQHSPHQILALLAPILKHEADLTIGSRFLDKGGRNIPRYRKFGIHIITWLFNAGSEIKLTDAQSGFRAYSTRIFDNISFTEKGMGISIEILIKAIGKGFTIQEVPITCAYHPGSSTQNPVRHGLGVALTVVKFRLKYLLKPRGSN